MRAMLSARGIFGVFRIFVTRTAEVTSLSVDIYHSPPFQECRLGLQEHTCEIKALEDLTFSPSLCVRSSVRTLRSSAYKNDCGEETQFG